MIIALEQLNLSLNALQILKTNNYQHTENIADLKFRKFKNSHSHMQFTDSAGKKNVFVYEKISSSCFHCPLKSYVFMPYFFTNTKNIFHSFFTYNLFKIKVI